MVDGTAARQTARDRDAMLFDIVCIDFFYGILIFANDDGIVVLPQDQPVLTPVQLFKYIFFKCQIIIRISPWGFYKLHISFLMFRLFPIDLNQLV